MKRNMFTKIWVLCAAIFVLGSCASKREASFVLPSGVSQFNEPNVSVGYGTMNRRDLTGAVVSISGDELRTSQSISVSQALQGRLSGVRVTNQGNPPNTTTSLRVRGGTSLTQSNEPLVLIDGVPGSLDDIPIAVIERIDVLKDASHTSIYGSRGANGVVLVTTIKPGGDR